MGFLIKKPDHGHPSIGATGNDVGSKNRKPLITVANSDATEGKEVLTIRDGVAIYRT